MQKKYYKQYKIIKKVFGISDIISIRFSDKKNSKYLEYSDTTCTSMARCFLENKTTFIDRQKGQLCVGGNYFLNIKKYSDKEVCKTYVKDEGVFKNEESCCLFLKKNPSFPKQAEFRYVLFSPLKKEQYKSDVVMMLAVPAQVGRILGLSVFKIFFDPLVLPAASTCMSIYAPLTSNRIHLNFIDYFDRYYQGKQGRRLLWSDNQMIISMPGKMFEEIIKNIPLSAHGSFKAKIKPCRVEKIEH